MGSEDRDLLNLFINQDGVMVFASFDMGGVFQKRKQIRK